MVVVAVVVVVADQLTKWWALERLSRGRVIDVVWTLRFALARNTGAAFSMGGRFGQYIGLLAVAVVVFLVWQGRTVRTRLGSIALGLVLGGALGNLADRAFRGDGGLFSGAVVDFVDLQWWPVFNVADASLVIGGILLVVTSFLEARDDDAARPAAS